jgi:hypothetical protein
MIWLQGFDDLSLYGKVSAAGGAGGPPELGYGAGGDGAPGRIQLGGTISTIGSTTPLPSFGGIACP